MSFWSKGRRWFGWAVLTLAILAMGGGCARQDATKALTESQQAIDALPPEVQQFLGADYERVKATHDQAQADFNGGNYKAATAKAKEAKASTDSLTARVEVRRAEFTREWAELGATIPGAIAALTARAAEVSKKLPAGVTAETLADAKADIEKLPRHWDQANALAQSGQLVDAVLIGRELKVQCEKLMGALGVLPGATTGAPAGATP
jgi:hypothetical protein